MTNYPPEAQSEEERHEVTKSARECDTIIRWSVQENGRPVRNSAIAANMLGIDYDPEADREWTIDVEIDHPVDVTLKDPDLQQRAYEVMQALAEGKSVTIED